MMRGGYVLGLCAALFLATPAFAADSPAALTAASLGLDGLTDPAPLSEATPVFEQQVQPTRALADLVGDFAGSETVDAETECLARAVYWESRGEPLSGQLAVAEVVINRARSGRFASTLCGVVRQPSQFSFVRRGAIPRPPAGSRDWHVAVAIARIATEQRAEGGAPRALFFHARRINPGWRLTRVATVGNHVFYR